MPRMRKSPHPKTASLSKWRCFLSKCHWGGGVAPPEGAGVLRRGEPNATVEMGSIVVT